MQEPVPKVLVGGNSMYKIENDKLVFEQKIGKGSFGIVWKGKWRSSPCAIKELYSQDLSEAELKEFESEATLMCSIRPHVNLVLFLGYTTNPKMTIVTEYCTNGSLFTLIHSNKEIEPDKASSIMLGIARGVLHLHTEGIIHRDLASRNVLLDASFNAKVADFGLSRSLSDKADSAQTKSDVGPLKWMAPESLRHKVYSPKSDAWAFGVTLWEMYARQEPYPDLNAVQASSRVVYEGLRLEIPSGTREEVARIMQMCWETDPDNRPNFEQLCEKIEKFQRPENLTTSEGEVTQYETLKNALYDLTPSGNRASTKITNYHAVHTDYNQP
eukprot:TRINITY_DN1228_c0_g1_i6.p1 TRINITY_DN1228_c0_g1~~TRINITY_DN1228_c0_g1_i6.p1  ORF type:complete len:328 (+),score=74.12 TRINITY_DN1228_c0_g1_i6:323-1306(+)